MKRFAVSRFNRWLVGILGVLVLAVAVGCVVVPTMSAAPPDGVAVGATAAIFFTAVAVWMLWEALRMSRLVWTLSETAIEQASGGARPIVIRWDEVDHARFRSLSSSLRIGARDGRRIDVTYYAADLGLLVLHVERALTRHRSTSLPVTIESEPTWGARWSIAVALLVGSMALIPALSLPVRLGVAGGAFAVASLGLVWWLAARERVRLALDDERLTVRHGWRTHVFELADLRGWAVGFRMVQPGVGHPALWLTTEDDSWVFAVPPRRWLEIAAAFRAAARHHPKLAWLPEPLLAGASDEGAAPVEPPATVRRARWRALGVAVVAGMIIAAAAATSAPPAPTALERARIALAAGAPGSAIHELERWLDRRPSDLDAHRVLVAAHIQRCRDPRPCDMRGARVRYDALRASGDPVLTEIGAWGLARIEGESGDPERAIAMLATIDARIVPRAPIDRAALLSAAGRHGEAAGELRRALHGPARADAEAAYARLLVRRGSVAALSQLVREAGSNDVVAGAARSLAAHQLRVGEWAAIQGRRAIGAPLSILAALVFAGARLSLARFWGGAHAPSWAESIGGAATGALLFAIGGFVADASALAGATLGAELRVVPIALLFRIALPITLALAWSRATGRSSPLGLLSRAGVIGAGIGAAWSLEWMLASGLLGGIDVAWARFLLPLEALAAPWAALWIVDLRERGWGAAGAWMGALAIAAGACSAARVVAETWPMFHGPTALCLFVAMAMTFKPLLSNAATLSRGPGPVGPDRSAAAPFFLLTVAALLVAWIGLTRVMPWPAALSAIIFVALAMMFVLPVLALFFVRVTEQPTWRRDWWRARAGE